MASVPGVISRLRHYLHTNSMVMHCIWGYVLKELVCQQ